MTDDLDAFSHMSFTDQLPSVLDEDLPCALDDLLFSHTEIPEEEKRKLRKISKVTDVVLIRLLKSFQLLRDNLKVSQDLCEEGTNPSKMKLNLIRGLMLLRLIELLPEEEETFFKGDYHFEMSDDSVTIFQSPPVVATPPK
ncbi:MAG: hypothetical protein WCV55_03430 [Candidatus Paceibacterota bacterium]